MPELEIERKFLVDTKKVKEFLSENTERVTIKVIEQVYLQREPEEIRIRRTVENGNTSFVKTIKTGHGLIRTEAENETTFEEFSKACQSYSVIASKTRHCIDGLEIDFFQNGLVTVEKEFESEATAILFDPSDYEFITDEITGNKFYSNYEIAKRG